jgi:hypothetical protein
VATTEQLQARLEALEEAMDSGEMRVKYADREVTYRSLQEMRSAAHSLRVRLGEAVKQPRTRYAEFTDGSLSQGGSHA